MQKSNTLSHALQESNIHCACNDMTQYSIYSRNLLSLLVLARGGEELTVGDFIVPLSRGWGCGPPRFGLGLNSVLKSVRSKPISSNSGARSISSASTSPANCSLKTPLGTIQEQWKILLVDKV